MSTFLRDIESNARFLAQPEYGIDFGSKEARIAAAMVAAGLSNSSAPVGTITSSFADISTTPDNTLFAANPNRQEVLIQNLSPNDIYIRIGSPAAINEGFKLLSNNAIVIEKPKAAQLISLLATDSASRIYYEVIS